MRACNQGQGEVWWREDEKENRKVRSEERRLMAADHYNGKTAAKAAL